MTDIEIARSTPLLPIAEVAQQIGIEAEHLEQYGKHIAKVPLSLIDESKVKRNHLILVTSIWYERWCCRWLLCAGIAHGEN